MTRVALILLLAVPVLAQDKAITLFAGVQGGGSLFVDGERYSVDAAPAIGLMLTFDRGRGRLLDIVAAHQQTEAGPADVTVDVIQIGGRYLLTRDRRANPYIALTAGATRIATGGRMFQQFIGSAGVVIRF